MAKLIWQGAWLSLTETYRVVFTHMQLIVERDNGVAAMGERKWLPVPINHPDYAAIALFALAQNPVDVTAAIEAIRAKVDGLALP
jgi:hypothetical protein